MLWLLAACSTENPPPAVDDKPSRPAPALEHAFPAPLEGPALTASVPTGLPDIVFVSIDTLRADHVGAYGNERDVSPFIDSLAARGVRFGHARSPTSWTLPAHTTMLTGQLPTTHGVVEDTLKLSKAVPVLPELLHDAGYATGGAVSTLFVSSRFGFERGFHHFQDFGILHKKLNLAGLVQMDDVVDDLTAYAASVPRERPLFLFLHTYDAHYAYDPPAPYDTMFDRAPTPEDARYRSYGYYRKNPVSEEVLDHQRAQYDESIRWIDDQLARLDASLRAAGRNPRWVITSDHGEEFGERGSWGHGHTLYAEQLHVPLIVAGPGIPQGVVVEEAVGTHDLAPTVASWAGVDGLDTPDGLDLTPYFDGRSAPPKRAFLAETSRHRTLRLGLWEDGRRLEWDVMADRAEVFTDRAETSAGPDADEAMQARVVELLGAPWTGKGGEVRVKKGRVLGIRPTRTRKVEAEEPFAVVPLDASFRIDGPEKVGPIQVGDETLTGVSWSGRTRPIGVDLDEDTRSALEALGYVHGD